MATQDTTPIKEKIISFLETNGPNIPVHIAKHINTNMIFASAFLSELLSNKKLKITHLRVGSSPIYYLQGQEPQLEKFSQHLKSKEREAYELLKEKRFLKDEEQEPAIRVALRTIKDFAFPIEEEGKIIWKYLTAKKEETSKKEIKKESIQELSTQIPNSILQDTKIELEKIEIKKEDSKRDSIKKNFKEEKETKEEDDEKPKKKKKATQKKASQKKNEKFFNTIKEYLTNKNIQIEDIETFSKDNLILKINENNQEKLLIAYNKKRITEEDIIKANRKASETNLKYDILSLGEPAKKTLNLVEAIKNLSELKILE